MAANTVMSCSAAAAAAAAVCSSVVSSSKSKFAASVTFSTNATSSRFTMTADWMPGQRRPSYLVGSAPGDFGFDPLGLGKVPENLEIQGVGANPLPMGNASRPGNFGAGGFGPGQLGQGPRMGRGSGRASHLFG